MHIESLSVKMFTIFVAFKDTKTRSLRMCFENNICSQGMFT